MPADQVKSPVGTKLARRAARSLAHAGAPLLVRLSGQPPDRQFDSRQADHPRRGNPPQCAKECGSIHTGGSLTAPTASRSDDAARLRHRDARHFGSTKNHLAQRAQAGRTLECE
jgi:hypothetical protein